MHKKLRRTETGKVAPFAGAWIETASSVLPPKPLSVAPFAGAWIETALPDRNLWTCSKSLPSRERGLKPIICYDYCSVFMSLPSRERGLKPLILRTFRTSPGVAPFAGAWIETLSVNTNSLSDLSLPSRERGLKPL